METQLSQVDHKDDKSRQVFFENQKYQFYLVRDERIVLEKAPQYLKLDEIFYMEFFFVMHKILNYLIDEKIDYDLFIDKQISSFVISITFRQAIVNERVMEAMQNMFEINTELF